MRCLVTGGAGFIGSHIVEALITAGHKVRVLDNLSKGSLDNLAAVTGKIDFISGDIQDEKVVLQALAGREIVFHLAALVSVPESVARPRQSMLDNDWGTLNLYRAAADVGVKRLVFSSSSAVYGDQPPPHHEAMLPRPLSPYAAHKLAGEHYGLVYESLGGLEFVNLRYFNVYGPRQDPSSPYSGVVSILMERFQSGQAPTIYGDGLQTRDFIHVSDVAQANLLAALTPCAAGRTFNVACGHSVSLNDLCRIMGEISNRPDLAALHAPERAGDLKYSSARVDLAQKVLGFVSRRSLQDGLRETWDRHKQRPGRPN